MPLPHWSRKLGGAAVLFFLAKGLMWLAIPTLLAWSAR
jgi:hypothetical protein